MAIIKLLMEMLNNEIITIWSDSEGIDSDLLDEYDIDDYKLYIDIDNLTKNSNINILRDKNIKTILYDINSSTVVGVLYDSYDGDKYSFDVIVNPTYQQKGYAKELVNIAISEFENNYQDYNPNSEMIIDVVNPNMEKLLLNKNFVIVDKMGENRSIMKYVQS